MRKSVISISAAVISIVAGLVLGLVVLFLVGTEGSISWSCFTAMLTSGFSSSAKFAKVLYQAAPLVMTGLSVGFAFKTGLFNIGAPGQYLMGAFAALVCAIFFQLPWPVCILVAMLAGAIWGALPGLAKAYFNVNEVITSIMLNWIGLFIVNLSLMNMPKMLPPYWVPSPIKDRTASLKYANTDAIIPKMGLDEFFGSPYINISIIIAILFAIVVYIILNRTTFGYELKACGHNRESARYAGINAKRNIILSMCIAGALSGVGGALYFLSGEAEYNILKVLQANGFNGIPVALLATSNPIGIIFSALFISYIQVGGEAMQPHFATEVIDIIVSIIIYLAAFTLLTKGLLAKVIKFKNEKDANAEPKLVDNTVASAEENTGKETEK